MDTTTTSMHIHGAVLTRRQFVKTGGTLIVGVSLGGFEMLTAAIQGAQQAVGRNSLDPSRVSSWFEVHADNTLTLRTGKSDFGQSTVTTAYKQIVAEELNLPYESITSVIMGDTDRTPDGGVSAGYLHIGGLNLRKAAAYTQQALLDVAATTLGVDRSQLTAAEGRISGGGKSITYGELVAGQELALSIPVTGDPGTLYGVTVTGDPPMKSTSQYTVIGKSYPNFVTASKVAAKETWVTDVRLPNMLHARVIHPKTLGSKLIAAGRVDTQRFPNAQVIVKGDLVGVVAPTEWEAIGAAQQVAAATEWTDWKGLPGHSDLYTWMREHADWKAVPATTGPEQGDPAAVMATAAQTLSASYEVPYMKHAPIGPTVAVADAKADGTVFVYTHNQHTGALRAQLALMLGTSVDNVVVRSFAGPGHYGRSNGGNAGAEDEAVLLSQAVGQPVRVQWTRPDDLMWSTSSPPGIGDVQLALDSEGSIVGAQFDHFMPAMQDDRPIGAVLAGLPTMKAPGLEASPTTGSFGTIGNSLSDPWVYDRVPNLAQSAHGTYQIGQTASPLAVGLRDHSMRTPGQLQQNVPREMAINEAAALAGADPLEYRLRHTADARLIGVLNAVRDASGWQSRTSPAPMATATGTTRVMGQGVSVMLRSDTYWACVCQISVSPATSTITIDKCTVAVDPGIVINPIQLRRQVQGGAMMGISHALYEEMRFDESAILSRDWRSYPIATMADTPEMEVVVVANPDIGRYGGVSEAANVLPMPAIAAALFDATGKVTRRFPLTPPYVQGVLQA